MSYYAFQPFSVVHGVLRLELIHVSSQMSDSQFYIAQLLIERGYADTGEESALSKVNIVRGSKFFC